MALSGEYDDIRAFIYDLENVADFVVIDNVTLAEGGDANAPLAVALDVSTYYPDRAGCLRQRAPMAVNRRTLWFGGVLGRRRSSRALVVALDGRARRRRGAARRTVRPAGARGGRLEAPAMPADVKLRSSQAERARAGRYAAVIRSGSAEAAAATSAAPGRRRRAGIVDALGRGAGGPGRAAAAAADHAEVHRPRGEGGRDEDRGAERRQAADSRRRRRRDRRAVPDSEDRTRIDRDCVPRRSRAADDSADRQVTNQVRQ